MIKLYHGVEAHAHPVAAGTPILRRDVDNIVVRIHRDQALALVAELTSAFRDTWDEVNLVLENAGPLIHKRSHWDDPDDDPVAQVQALSEAVNDYYNEVDDRGMPYVHGWVKIEVATDNLKRSLT